MIKSFAGAGASDIWHGINSKAARNTLPPVLWSRAAALLDRINAATSPADLRLPPSNRLHRLRGDMQGMWSVSVNMQYRITFRFSGTDAFEVQIIDYH